MDETSMPFAARPVPVIANRDAGGAIARRLRGVRKPEANSPEATEAATRLVEVAGPEIPGAVRRAMLEGAPTVGVSGGDGTLHGAAQILAGSGVALLPVPTGTLNQFARRYGVPTIEDALRAIRSGEDRSVPLGVTDDTLFLNTLVIGAYADVVRRRERLRKVAPKWPAAAVAFILTLLRGPHFRLTLDSPAGRIERETAFVWIGLGRGSFPDSRVPPPDRSPTLEVAVLRTRPRRHMVGVLLRLASRMLRSRDPAADPRLEVFHAPHLLIRADGSLPVTVDGERSTIDPPVYVSVVPAALRVRVPSD